MENKSGKKKIKLLPKGQVKEDSATLIGPLFRLN